MAAIAEKIITEFKRGIQTESPTSDQPVLSVVLPIFNEEENIRELYRRLTEVIENLGEPYELVFVNDGSSDQSFPLLCHIAAHDRQVKVVNFARNFGHQVAITAGLDHSCGQTVVVMDADLQDPPEVISALIAKWREGYDVVYASRVERQGEGIMKRVTAALFYRLLRFLTKVDIPADTGDFRLMSRQAVNALRRLREHHRFVRGLSSWIGFRQTAVPFVREARYAGETKYPLKKMVKFALDGVTSFSFVPLQLATYIGFGVATISCCFILYAVGLKLLADRAVTGWTSLFVAVLFVGSIQLITLGIVGEYIGRIYDEVKQRPLYIVADIVGFAAESPTQPNESNGQGRIPKV